MPYTPFANDAYTYDAAGNVNTVTSSSSTVLGQDGDGRQVKSTETVTDPQSGQTTTTTRYYVRSTVLGGAVLTEMELTNNYTRTFVYLEGALLATQQSNGIPWVSWEHRDPSNATYWSSDATNLRDRAELDPVGANMGLSDSTYTQSVPDEGSLSPYPSFSSGSNLGTTYSWDGIPMPADEFFQMVGTLMHGPLGVVEASARASAPRLVSYSVSLYHGRLTRDFGLNLDKALNEGIEQGNLTRNWIVSDNWALDYGLFPQQPIMTGFSLGPHANFTYGEQSILKQVYDRITQKDCVDFVNGVLAENKVSKDLNELWKLTNKAVLNKWDSGLTAQGLGISQAEFTRIQNGFEGKGLAVTMSDRTRIYLGDRMFLREGNDSPFKIWSSFTNIDTAGHLVHELFHIAGISHPEGQGFDFDAEIHKNCGLAKTNW